MEVKEELYKNNKMKGNTIMENKENIKVKENKKQSNQEFGCTREAKNLLRYLDEAITKSPKKYRYFICSDMHRCIIEIIHLINECNNTCLDRKSHGLNPSKKYKLKRLEYHRDIYTKILDFQHYLESCENFSTKSTISPIFTEKEIINMTQYLGKLKSLAKSWEDNDVERAEKYFLN